jgi:hypothetical protein
MPYLGADNNADVDLLIFESDRGVKGAIGQISVRRLVLG